MRTRDKTRKHIDANVSAYIIAVRVLRPPSEEIYSKSTMCHFLLIVNSNCGRIIYRLQDIFAYRCWKSRFSTTVFWL